MEKLNELLLQKEEIEEKIDAYYGKHEQDFQDFLEDLDANFEDDEIEEKAQCLKDYLENINKSEYNDLMQQMEIVINKIEELEAV